MSHDHDLYQARERIDRIDEQLLTLISERAVLAREIAHIKLAAGTEDADFYRPEREAAVLRRTRQSNPGPLDGETVVRLFREIMSACLALEQQLQVAFLGPEGTFTQAAALKQFGHAIRTVPLVSIAEIFREVEAGACHFGVVPVENSTEGVISHTLDTLLDSPLSICGEVTLRIHHHLLSHEGALSGITRIYSHQQSLAQCRGWLDHNLPHAEREAMGSNAEAARRAASEPHSAAVAAEAAAEIYGLDVLARNIEDEPNNTTRFLVVGRRDAPPSGQDKTSLLLGCRNVAGALYRLLTPLARHNISMTRIESRPSRLGLWDYVFFIDIQGHRLDPAVHSALTDLEGEAKLFRVLGSYPEAVL